MLVVDDRETSRLQVSTLLRARGCRPGEADSGENALAMLRAALREGDPYRVALIDIEMPAMNGEELGNAIQADPEVRGTPIVLMKPAGISAHKKWCDEPGLAACIAKPICQSQLYARVALALRSDEGCGACAASKRAARPSRHRGRILIAEDTISNQEVALVILKKLGYRADAVANGREAVEALRRIPYDLVLMDCQMPEMNGYQAAERIRDPQSGLPNPGVPIVALTAHAMQGDRERCLASGMNDYISKPFSSAGLATVLKKWLPWDAGPAGAEPGGIARGESPTSAAGLKVLPPAVFDEAALMQNLLHDWDLARSVVNGFLENIPEQLAALSSHLAAGDIPGAQFRANCIKGAAASVSGKALEKAASKMEQAGKAGDLRAMSAWLPMLEQKFQATKEIMERMKGGTDA